MDYHAINHDRASAELPEQAEAPDDAPDTMDIEVPMPHDPPRNNNRRVPPKRKKSKLGRKRKTSKFDAQDEANWIEAKAAVEAAAEVAAIATTNKRKKKHVNDSWKKDRTIHSQHNKIKKLTNNNTELVTTNNELKSANANLQQQLKQAHHANHQDKKASRQLYLSQVAELEARMKQVQDEALKAQLKSIAAEEKVIRANQKAKADVKKERAISKQKVEKELKGNESIMLHMQEQHEKEVEKLHMKVKDKEEEVEKVCCMYICFYIIIVYV